MVIFYVFYVWIISKETKREQMIFTIYEWDVIIFRVHQWEQGIFTKHKQEQTIFWYLFF